MFEKPEQVFQSWLKGVNSGELSEVASLYSKDAVLLPTFSNKLLIDSEGIKGYFEKLANHKNLSVELYEKTVVVQSFSTHLYSMSSIYRWKFEVDGEPLTFEARFTFTIDLSLSGPIVHHHSSQVPQML